MALTFIKQLSDRGRWNEKIKNILLPRFFWLTKFEFLFTNFYVAYAVVYLLMNICEDYPIT